VVGGLGLGAAGTGGGGVRGLVGGGARSSGASLLHFDQMCAVLCVSHRQLSSMFWKSSYPDRSGPLTPLAKAYNLRVLMQ
jgi:hypothetical protein